jgi:hypothetical protein
MIKELRIYKLVLVIAVCGVAFSCKKKVDVSIESLSKSGEEFYFGERVPVWAVTSGGDRNDISYEWSASGGSFDDNRTANLFENLWIAPDSVGEYTVTAKVKSDGSSSSRSTTMKVTRYYFDEFQSAYTLNGNGWSTSNTSNKLLNDTDPALSTLELTASSSSTPNIRRTLDLAELKIPFSVRTKLAWKNYFRANSTISIRLFFKQPSNPNYPFIREIRWEIWPTVNPATTDNYQIRYETFIPATNTSKFSAVGNTLPSPLPLIDPVKGKRADHVMGNGVVKSFSMSVDANNIFHAYVDGVLWFTSTGIKDWLDYARANYPGFEDPVANQYEVDFPSKESNKSGTTLVMKSVYINNDGQILK